MTRQNFDIHIRARDNFTKTMRKAEVAVQGLQKVAQTMQKHWLALGATILAVNKAWDLAGAAASFDQQEQAFANLAASHHANAETIIKDLDRMAAGTISTANIMQSAGKAMLLGIPADKLNSMMEIARAASRVTGDTVQKSFDDIATGMGRQSKLILDNLGIIIKVEEANKAYAKEMGIVGRALTDVEKKQAFMNATMKAGQDIVRRVAVRGLTASEAMAKFSATMQNFGIILGKVIISLVSFTGAALTGISTTVNAIFGFIIKFARGAVGLLAKIPGASKFLQPLQDGLQGLDEHQDLVTKTAADMTLSQIEVGTSIWGTKKAVDGLNRSLGETPEAAEASIEAQKKIKALLAKEGPGAKIAASKELEGLDPEQAQMATRMTELQTFHDNRMTLLAEMGASEEQMQEAHNARLVDLERQKEEALISVKRNALGSASSFFTNMASLSGKHGKKMFKIAQGFAIGQAVVDGIAAVQGAYKWGSILGGPVLGAAFAVAAAAATAANIKRIASASPGGAGGGAATGGGGASVPNTSRATVTPPIEEGRQKAGIRQDITIIVKSETGDVSQETIDRFSKGFNIAAVERNVTFVSEAVEG